MIGRGSAARRCAGAVAPVPQVWASAGRPAHTEDLRDPPAGATASGGNACMSTLRVWPPRRPRADARLRAETSPLSTFDEPPSALLELSEHNDDERQHIGRSLHFELVYGYRNFIVHEFREPGYGMESFADGGVDPLYHAYLNDPTWHLVYPVGFFQRLAEGAITSLEAWLISSSVNPYDRVRDSSDWYSR